MCSVAYFAQIEEQLVFGRYQLVIFKFIDQISLAMLAKIVELELA